MNLWLVAVGMGIVTYGIRLSVLVFVHHTALPSALRDALNYVTPAVLTAIIVSAVLYVGDEEDLQFTFGNERIVAALLAALVAWLTKNVWATITAGMSMLWLLEAAI
jgi:branched-subunit amino acid transport protein